MHTINPLLLNGRHVDVLVVGCGGTGAAVAGGLPYLQQALVAAGHPGLSVTLMDGDTISPTNCVRQPFSRSEIGLKKATVLAHRINTFWGFDWRATPRHLGRNEPGVHGVDIVIGCVDSRKARAAIKNVCFRTKAKYWLDIGNTSAGGQFILGEPGTSRTARGVARDDRAARGTIKPKRLKTVAELYPEVVNEKLDDPSEPSCSAIEALERQEPFVNQVLATHALALLARLFRHGEISYQGGFVSIETGQCSQVAA